MGGVTLWLAYPPLAIAPLAWIAPVAWVMLIRRERLAPNTGASKRRRGFFHGPYFELWAAGLLFWLMALYWLLIPGWNWTFGWLALSLYLSVQLPAFVWLSRVMVHRWGVPLVLAAPVVWTGLELAHARLAAEFSMCGLALTQYRWEALIQISDTAGGYAVSFVLIFAAACLARMLPCEGRRYALWPVLPLGAILGATLAYGQFRLAERADDTRSVPATLRPTNVALIQCSFGREYRTPGRKRIIHSAHLEQSRSAVARWKDLDLIVWPETTFGAYLVSSARETSRHHVAKSFAHDQLEKDRNDARRLFRQATAQLQCPMLVGLYSKRNGPHGMEKANTALLVGRQGEVAASYDKMHAVMYAEYVPGANAAPWLNAVFGMTDPITPGTGPAAFRVGGLTLSPSICYEITLPHLIHGHVATLRAAKQEPDALVVLSNNGWFWGSAEQDLILMNAVFRAVENRKPVLIAANTGISASISGDGRMLAHAPRNQEAVLRAEVRPDGRRSWHSTLGDWPAAACLMLAALAGLWGLISHWYLKKPAHSVTKDA